MTPNPDQLDLAPAVRSKLAALRRRIRRYVWLEGLTTAIAWLGVAFWLSLAIDRFFEPLRPLRATILGLAGLWLAWVLFRRIVRRAFVPLEDRHMAMLLERHFPQFDESLLTAVELVGRSRPLGPHTSRMLAQTCRQAAEPIDEVRLRKVFNPRPLCRSTLTALALAVSVWAFAALAPEAFSIWARRSLLLADQPWPHNTRLLVEGFDSGTAKVARGDDLEVIALADLTMPVVPNLVEVRYQTESGARLQASMSREGVADRTADRFQQYAYTFRGVLAPIRFDVVGGDDAVKDLRIEVVDSPTIVDMSLECTFPDYIDRPPRTLPVAGVMQLPAGTRITVRATANKDLVKVEVDDGEQVAQITEGIYPGPEGEREESEQGRQGPREKEAFDGPSKGREPPPSPAGFRSFRHLPPVLTEDTTLLFTLFDTDGITSRRPVRLALATVADQPPQLSVELGGIGSAITPQARLPAAGRITDDYGIDNVWFDYAIDDREPATHPIESPSNNATDLQLDQVLEVGDLELTAGEKLLVCVKAADRFDLGQGPNVGTSQRRLLDVVTPEQLRTLLEAREIGLRQRFERIIEEVTETRDLLTRIDFDGPASQDDGNQQAEPNDDNAEGDGEEAEPGEKRDAKDESSPQQALALRTLRVQRALQNSRKNAHETLAVAEAFEGIREELINNRLDNAQWNDRLQRGIADPLRKIAEGMFPQLDRRLEQVETALSQDAGPRNRDLAVAQVDTILESMRKVLERMLQLEDFSKAIERLREIIRVQQRLSEQTRKRHKQKLRQLLED